MTRPPAVVFAGRAKWGDVVVDLALAAAGGLLVLVAAPELSGPRPVGLWLLVLYTCFAVAVTLVLAVAVALTSQLPCLEDTVVDARPAVVLRSWAAPWWHSIALDLALAVLGIALATVGLAAGGGWAVLGALAGVVGAWFLVRVGLVVLGRRRRPALWLTAEEVVVDSPAGRARAPRGDVRAVRARGRSVVVELDRDATWVANPRPWRHRAPARDTLVVDCTDTGHRASDVADWLAAEAAPGSTVPVRTVPVSTGPGRGRTRPARRPTT
jgi:hypothetical protein